MIGYGDGLGIPKPVRAFGLTFTVIFLLLNSQFLLPFLRHSSELLVEARAVYSGYKPKLWIEFGERGVAYPPV